MAILTPSPLFTPSREQLNALRAILKWLATPGQPEFRLGGYAGTGKSTIIRWLLAILQGKIEQSAREWLVVENLINQAAGEKADEIRKLRTAIAAFTGKAVSVLRRKGIDEAQTLHTLLYDARTDPVTKIVKYEPKANISAQFAIVDEGSMVSRELYDTLCRHPAKRLFCGDPAQLEPIGDNPNLMAETNVTLEEIHRQAEQSPILKLATAIRSGRFIESIPNGSWGTPDDGTVTICSSASGLDLANFDVILCGKNKTRHAINNARRKTLGFVGDPQVGEPIMCRSNNWPIGVYNGLVGTILNVGPRETIQKPFNRGQTPGEIAYTLVDFEDDLGTKYEDVPMLLAGFEGDVDRSAIPAFLFRDYVVGAFAYAQTVHTSQGSEYDDVCVIDEPLYQTDMLRWRYTAITRAAKNLTYVR